jgi:RNA polymerase sigma-70 factor (ECF subfamily)
MKTMERNREAMWVERLRHGDESVFDEIFDALNPRLLAFLERMARQRSVAEDLLEETWLRLVANAKQLRADTNLVAWLYTVARNLFLSHCRARAREQAYTAEWLALWPNEVARGPYEEAATSEFERRLERALGILPATHREVLLLVGVEGLRSAEAAEVCGISAEALRQRLSRARQMLDQAMRQLDDKEGNR